MVALAGATAVWATWVVSQRGTDIDGEAAGDYSGKAVSVSSDGSIVAIGAPNNGGTGPNSGSVRVHAWNGSAWAQRGTDINGEATGDFSGRAVSMSGDGSIVAIGAFSNDGNGSDSGSVRVYAWNGSAWTQRGADIDGEAAGDEAGSSVSVSSDGSIVAIGAPYNDGASGLDSGSVRVYAWNGTSWAQRGTDIDGEATGDFSGWAVSMSSDGSIVAIGASNNDGNGSNSGSVRVYAWNGSAWAQRGSDINGEAAGDFSGRAVSVSSDGSIVAIGAPNNAGTSGASRGSVRVYAWSGTSWAQRGADIDGEAANDESGTSVSVSSDGSIVAIGAPFNNGASGADSGHVRVYGWNGSAWAQRGTDIDGEAANDYSGWAVSMSSDGSIVAIGAPNNGGNGLNSGSVRVYALTSEPGAPTGVTGTAGNGQVEVSWSAPASTGGATIIAYTVTASPGGRSCSWTTGPLSCTVTGLTNGTAYTFTVTAINAVGTGSASSASSAVTPRSEPSAEVVATVPAPTVSVTATTPTSIRWSKPSKGQPTVATFDAAPQTTYSISATLTSPARAAKKARGSCTIAAGKATCRIRLTTKGRWVVAITPSTGGVTGKPAEKTILVRAARSRL